MFVVFILVSFCGTVYAEDTDKTIHKKGQGYKRWTNKNGVQRIYPIYLVAKVARLKAAVVASKAKKKEKVAKPERVEEPDSAAIVVEEMGYAACRDSLSPAENMASVHNVVFDDPKDQKLTVLMVVDEKTLLLKCEYGNRVTTAWDS